MNRRLKPWRSPFVVLIVIWLVSVGCDSGSKPLGNREPRSAAGASYSQGISTARGESAEVRQPEATAQESAVTAVVRDANGSWNDAAKDGGNAQDNGATSAKLPESKKGRERLMIMTLGGPLVIDARLTIDGRSHHEVHAELVEQVLAASDTDGDGRPTWGELAANRSLYSQAEQADQPSSEQLEKMWVERFDQHRDGEVQREEAASWLGRDSGRRATELAVRGTRSYFANASAASQLWQLVDDDGDGRLSVVEVREIGPRMLAFDVDDDRVIVPGELIPLREQLQLRGRNTSYQGTADSRDAVIRLTESFDPVDLEILLMDLYSPRRRIGPESLPASPALFGELDTNGDSKLEATELGGLSEVASHLELTVNYDSRAEHRATLTVHEHNAEIALTGAIEPDRVVISFGDQRLTIFADDLGVDQEGAQGPERHRSSLIVHDRSDALFDVIDLDGDGQIGEREIGCAKDEVGRLDLNRDGEITPNELRQPLTVAFVRAEPAGSQAFYQTQVRPRDASADAPSWFVSADFNGDGVISRREFLGRIEQFDEMDADGDGFLSGVEAGGTAAR